VARQFHSLSLFNACSPEYGYKEGLFFITFTWYKWMSLIEYTNSYDLVYNRFDFLEKNHRIAIGYAIMPNHVHTPIDFAGTDKKCREQ
jgi:hypothetical protein